MGIKGLWNALKPYVHDGHLSHFRHQRVAVDMYVWLHRSVLGCVEMNFAKLQAYLHDKYVNKNPAAAITPDDLVQLSSTYIDSVVHKVEALQRFGLVPVCVFDGAAMPMKSSTDRTRREGRDGHFSAALQLLEEEYLAYGRIDPQAPRVQEAVQQLEKSLDISPELAHGVIQVLREERHVQCIVAPYEADAELAYLCRIGYVQAAISEDSDLIAYLCPCVLAKLDLFSGRCSVLLPPESAPCFYAQMAAAGSGPRAKPRSAAATKLVGFGRVSAPSSPTSPPSRAEPAHAAAGGGTTRFTYESFLLACIMAGCDYVANLRSIGVKTAFKLVAHANSLPQLLRTIEAEYGFPSEEIRVYRRAILAAFYCFAHHLVFCPLQGRLLHYHPLPTREGEGGAAALKTELVGERWPDEVARRICAECLLDPTTHELYRGHYQGCVQAYLQRTRRGQVSLRTFAAFRNMEANRVVLPAGGVKRPRDAEAEDDVQAFNATPLRKKTAAGFIGHHPTTAAGTSAAAPSSSSGQGERRTIVRSKFFVQRRGAVSGDCWSSSEEDSGPTGGPSASRAGSHATHDSTENTASADVPAETSPASAALRAVTSPERRAAFNSSGSWSSADVGAESSATTATDPAAPRCPCANARCHRRHSIFERCSQDKPWLEESPAEPLLGGPFLPSPPSQQPVQHVMEARRPAFRPPRSTAGQTSSPPLSDSGQLANTKPTEQSAKPCIAAAALFEQLAYTRH